MARPHRERTHHGSDLIRTPEAHEGEQRTPHRGDAYHQYIMDMCDQVDREVDYYLEHGKWPAGDVSSPTPEKDQQSNGSTDGAHGTESTAAADVAARGNGATADTASASAGDVRVAPDSQVQMTDGPAQVPADAIADGTPSAAAEGELNEALPPPASDNA